MESRGITFISTEKRDFCCYKVWTIPITPLYLQRTYYTHNLLGKVSNNPIYCWL